MPGWCRLCPQSHGGIITLFNTPRHRYTHKNTHSPLTSVLRNPRQAVSLSTTYCCNTEEDFHIRKPPRTNTHLPNLNPKPFEITAEFSDKVRKIPVVSYLEFARRRRDFLSHSLSRWLWRMKRDYGSDLLVLLGVGYWLQGFRSFAWLTMSFYLKDKLMVDPRTLQFLQNTVNLPMVAKPVYGIFSDAIYIGGAHRLPYIVLGDLSVASEDSKIGDDLEKSSSSKGMSVDQKACVIGIYVWSTLGWTGVCNL